MTQQTIAIFRQAKADQISTLNHLLNTHSIMNSNINHNPNKDNENTLMYFNNDTLFREIFVRNNKNQDLLQHFNTLSKKLDAEARADYKTFKTEQKLREPNRKIRTVLQTKKLEKEFIIALGGDKVIDNIEDFEINIAKTTKKILEKKGLSLKNLICITVHYDETTAHAHIQYNDYSFEHHTTATEFCKIRSLENKTSKEIRQLNNDNFSEFQDIVSEMMQMRRGERNSKARHQTKAEFLLNLSKKFDKSKAKAIKSLEKQKTLELIKK